MKMKICDICDRISILRLKKQRLPKNEFVLSELNELEKAATYFSCKKFINKLYIINKKIWDLEFDIRTYKEDKLGMEEVGKRAIKIRNINKKRIEIKNKISVYYNELPEVKVDHASEISNSNSNKR